MPRSVASLLSYVLWWLLAAVGVMFLMTGMGWPIGLALILIAAGGGFLTRLSLHRQSRTPHHPPG